MASKQTRKLQKRKDRERQVAVKQRDDYDRLDYRRHFPGFRFEHESDADPQFVAAVHEALKDIDLRDPRYFHPSETEVYLASKHRGSKVISSMLADEKTTTVATRFLNKIGAVVFARIGEQLLQWIPYNDVRILPLGAYILVIFRGLQSQRGPFGTVYYSQRRPQIVVNGKSYTVAWSKHAIEQTCNRIKPGWQTYSGLGDAYAFFDECRYFEPVELRAEPGKTNMGFTFYDECVTNFFSERYVKDILGGELKPGKHYFRVGYCPADIEGGFFKALSLLCPGYRSTPEFRALYQANLPFAQKRILMDQARQLDSQRLIETKDFSLLRWYHEHGVPQVIETDRKMYHAQTSAPPPKPARTKLLWRT